VFDGVADAVIAVDADLRIRFVNPAARELFGYSREELESFPIADVIPTYAERARGYDGKSAIEAQGRHADGRAFPLEIAFGEGVDGERRRTIVIARDITQRK
ncbi:MAG: PAS domain S-box protein, partial [Candidatus Velthaea sp.]